MSSEPTFKLSLILVTLKIESKLSKSVCFSLKIEFIISLLQIKFSLGLISLMSRKRSLFICFFLWLSEENCEIDSDLGFFLIYFDIFEESAILLTKELFWQP